MKFQLPTDPYLRGAGDTGILIASLHTTLVISLVPYGTPPALVGDKGGPRPEYQLALIQCHSVSLLLLECGV